ncbi:hypothetical protein HJG60_011587 [Phyllostomus discolor]|uniref:Uncharacterized protein n=1 Tax=Phyllostomus discolor TaxID=89673 RepID=A0A833ZYB7_9CHIR|nr:hypothetical protein HJG60_011587 [Phyllostomus discolor]
MKVFITMNFPLITAFDVPYKFWYVIFLICSKIFFKFPFDPWLFKRVLVNFHVFVTFPVFLLLLTSHFMPLFFEKILGMILTFKNLSGPVLRPATGSVLGKVRPTPEKKAWVVCCCWGRPSAYGCWDIWSTALFKPAVSLLDFLSGCSVYYGKWSIEVSSYYCITVWFSL